MNILKNTPVKAQWWIMSTGVWVCVSVLCALWYWVNIKETVMV